MPSLDLKKLTGAQLRAARALAGITAEDLAKKALIGVATVRRAEAQSGLVRMTTSNAQRLIDALAEYGVVLTDGEGVRRT